MLEEMHASLDSLEVNRVPASALVVWMSMGVILKGCVVGAWDSSTTSITATDDLSSRPLRKDLREYLSNSSN
jgi:hypothetical protein